MSSCPDQADGQSESKKLSNLDVLLDCLAKLCIISAGFLLVFLVAIFGWLVFGRYVLNDTPTWVEQASLVIAVYITCLGAAAGVRNNSHLSIDFIREGLSPLPREIMRYLSDAFVLVFGGFMAWQGWLMVMGNFDRPIPIIGLSESWRAAPLVICGVLMMLFSGVSIVERIFFPKREKE
ncbi:TRAP-type C4-dicarboxylate transport system, small permease component [Modicisalibacter muralis]|uniref:TRAP transporter small permease protein n=1 Tax=Modicisalibacter muralis TaxID=119000 RepID=A0A1G9Q0G7_9GAMM|nr:TRAP transporter small permease [Halomonas muralis]SDM03815.1 TRAP-type C4-dicarboxylate transport system, small permease component [Halomonas muralis]